MSIPYRFMPWARRGLARSHQNPDAAGAALLARPKVSVGLTIQARRDGVATTAVSSNIDLTLYGPGDVIGIDPQLIVRTEPKPNISNFEPNYLAAIDFDPPDFPWLLTPARANDQHKLRPWLALVVLERRQVAPPVLKPGRPLPSITLSAVQMASELPDLAESWLWAHAQAVSPRDANDGAGLALELPLAPERNVSRLVCPRRLKERTPYVACVVPAFDAGRLRGLGQPVAGANLGPAWNLSQPADTELPVYFHWEFSTGPVGDIETLARRLKRPEQYADDSVLIEQLRHIGEQVVAVDADHLLFAGTTPARTVFEGAMVSVGFTPAPQDDFAAPLAAMLNSGPALAADGTPKADAVPTLAPPIYGEHPARRHAVLAADLGRHWLDDISLQPRYRLAAGWGAEIVRRNQDEFMQAAWQQVGEVLAAQRALSLARLAHDVLRRVEVRHLAKLPDARLLALLAPAQARIKVGPAQSLYGRIGAATLPDELFGGAMRRLTSARRATLRMARWRERDLAQDSIAVQHSALVGRFANASQHLDAIDPNRFTPDGLVGSKSFDAIPLPADAGVQIDLAPYLGMAGSMTAGEIRQIQQQNVSLRAAASAVRKPPAMGDVWHRGLLTETHAVRLAALEREAGVAISGNVRQLIQQASPRGAEGVLLSVQRDGPLAGQLSAQALKIDGRSGNLLPLSSTFVAGPQRPIRAPAAARIAVGSVAAVPIRALRLYGNDAVFSTLPVNALGQGGDAVPLALTAPGRFDVLPGRRADAAIPTITVPPAIKDQAVLRRYSAAFKDYQALFAATPAALLVQPVDFALASAARQVRERIDPRQTVPARLASALALGGQPVRWTPAGLVNTFIDTALHHAYAERLRYAIPRSFDRVMAYPHLPFPLSRKLEQLAPEVFLPGVGALPDDFIMAVETNPRFVEALMVGANHEMGRELLWQGLPTDQRGTPFQHFWQRLGPEVDIAPVNEWHKAPLGQQPGRAPMLVLLLRGQLLARFPTLSIYAYPRGEGQTRLGGAGEIDPAQIESPVLKGHLGNDITYLGFNIDPQVMERFFFVLQEQMTEPRFGFDDPEQENQPGQGWLSVDWGEVAVAPGQHFGSAQLRLAPPASANASAVAAWAAPHAATVADALLQRPFRGYYAGARLKTPKPG